MVKIKKIDNYICTDEATKNRILDSIHADQPAYISCAEEDLLIRYNSDLGRYVYVAGLFDFSIDFDEWSYE